MTDARATRAGTVTVVFTDLVASTELRQMLGDDRADDLRREHDRLVREVTAEHAGTEIKALGDGFMLVFGAAAEAVGAAVMMQQAVVRLARRAPVPVEIRVGLSAGDVVWENGDCFGTPVVEASRLCGAAAPGQILVSDVVRLLAGSRGGHSFTTVGSLQLKGLAEPIGTSEVAWKATAAMSLPLPSALTARGQGRFVGRAAERERLLTAWKEAVTGMRRVALVSGEPGVGKTRLASELARAAHDDGATVLYGRCEEDLGVPYQPFVEGLRPYVADCPADDLAEQVAPYGGDLARLVPELAERVTHLADPLVADPETERYRLFDAVTSFLTNIVASTPVLLVLDDLHWAAKPTLLLLRHLTRAEWSGPLLVVGTYRDTDLSRTHPLAEMLADLRREGDAERIALHGLDAQEVEQFVAAAAGHELDADAAELARLLHYETEGNPFFIGQVLRHLVESGAIVEHEGRWVRGVDADEIGIPEGVREVVGRRLARLEPDTNDVLAAAAVVGREFDRDILTEAVNADEEAVLDALEESEEARLITSGDGRAGRYAFVHALVRSTLYEEIPTTRRLRLHRRIGEALEESGVDAHLDQLAYHFAEAAALGQTEKSVEYGRRAAEHASARLAYEEAVGHYERALGSLDPDSSADRITRAELLVELGRALSTIGERARGREHLDAATTLAREVGRADLLARAAIIRGGVRAWSEAGVVDDELIALFDEALALYPEGDSPLRAMMTARMASELYFRPGATERRRELTDAAVAMARRLDDPKTLAYVLNAAHWGMLEPGTERDRIAMAREMLDLATASGDRGLEATSRSWLASDLLQTGDVAGAITEADRELALAQELRQPDLLWAALVKQAAIVCFQGRLGDAERLAEDALAAGRQAEIETALQMYGVLQLALRRMRGGLEDLIDVIAAMVEQYPLVPAWRSGLAYLYRELGRLDEARGPFEVTAADDFAMLPRDGNWMVGIAISATVNSSLGDTERAAWLYRELAPFEDAVVIAGLPADVLGSAHHFLMMLAATLERWDDFERHAREALARNDAMGARPWAATTRLELATILTRRGHAGDDERARQILAECLDTCDELGLPNLAQRARRVLEEGG
jgi:class 3 adenylate cyclase/tetratricopeptide (TPR) repeat protein